MTTNDDAWNPTQYELFKAERAKPFYDLVALVRPEAGMRILDLGCGTGELTRNLARLADGVAVLGVDSSAAMLERAATHAGEGVSFEKGDIADDRDYSDFDLVLSNAAFQWVPDNERLLRRILSALAPGSQIAVQVPKNEAHASHRIASAVADEEPFATLLGDFTRRPHALTLERYAELLYEHGFREQECVERIYGHLLGSSSDVVEWVKGTLLTAYLSRLDAESGAAFVARYRARLLAEIGDRVPYFYPFRRLLVWGRKSK